MVLKKILFFLLTLVLSTLITTTANAQETGTDPVQELEPVVSYDLAYPGLLPDHPLYFLKAARDRIQSFFISDPVKKAQFDLLQADKRVMASYFLIQKGQDKVDLAQSTFSKAANYFEEAIGKTNAAKTQGVNIDELAGKLLTANKKHQEILGNIQKQLSKTDKNKFAAEAERLKDFQKKVNNLN